MTIQTNKGSNNGQTEMGAHGNHRAPIRCNRTKRYSVLVFIVVALICCKADKPVRLGFIGGTSGRAADMGIAARNGAQLAVAHWNERGGIHGRRVALLIKDDQHHAETAGLVVQELIEEKVAAIVGPAHSNMAVAITPYLNKSHVVAVGTTVTTQELSGLDDFFFRVCPTAREHAYRSAEYQLRSGNMRRVAAAYDDGNRTFAENWLANFKKAFTAGGGEIIRVVAFSAETGRSFSKIADRLVSAAPDGILIIANAMDSALLCQQIRKIDSSINMTLSNWGATERLLELGGKAVEGVTMPIAFDWDSPSPAYRAFRQAYLDRYKQEPGFSAAYAYDATQVVLTALEAGKSGESLKKTLLSMGAFPGLQSNISFDANGDVEPLNVSIRMVRNRKFAVAEQ